MTYGMGHGMRGAAFGTTAVTLALSTLMSLSLFGCAEDELGSEWETMTAATSPIRLFAPGLGGGIERYFSTRAASRIYT
ncbi:MAG: hypothetical protein ACREDZ_17470, partial [Kiloniellales bacterium]